MLFDLGSSCHVGLYWIHLVLLYLAPQMFSERLNEQSWLCIYRPMFYGSYDQYSLLLLNLLVLSLPCSTVDFDIVIPAENGSGDFSPSIVCTQLQILSMVVLTHCSALSNFQMELNSTRLALQCLFSFTYLLDLVWSEVMAILILWLT